MDCLSVFNPSWHLILFVIIIYIYFFTHALSSSYLAFLSSSFCFCFFVLFFFCFFFFLCFFVLCFFVFFFFQMWLQESLWLLQSLTVPPSTCLPRHFRDRQFHQNDMSFEAYMEHMGHIIRLTFNGSWSGDISQVWFTIAVGTTLCL